MSEYASYFKQDSEWSLINFDSWCLQKTNGCHANKIHRIFYKHMNDVLLKDSSTEQERSQARNLIKNRKVSSFKKKVSLPKAKK
jgi:hypothetical protein